MRTSIGYTGTVGEERFFLLVKQGEAVELAVNDLLCPLTRDRASLIGEDAREFDSLAELLTAQLNRSLQRSAQRLEQDLPDVRAVWDRLQSALEYARNNLNKVNRNRNHNHNPSLSLNLNSHSNNLKPNHSSQLNRNPNTNKSTQPPNPPSPPCSQV